MAEVTAPKEIRSLVQRLLREADTGDEVGDLCREAAKRIMELEARDDPRAAWDEGYEHGFAEAGRRIAELEKQLERDSWDAKILRTIINARHL